MTMNFARLIGGFGVLLVVAGLLPVTRDELKWRAACSHDRARDYAGYLEAWPGGRHAVEARARSDERSWAEARQEATPDSFRRYEESHPTGAHAAEARSMIEELTWQETWNNVASLDAYLERYPSGRHAADAKSRIENLLWRDAEISDSVDGFERYLGRFGAGRFADAARSRIEELRWRAARNVGTIGSFEAYLEKHSAGRFAAEAGVRIEELMWARAKAGDSVRSHGEYLARFQTGRYASAARARIEELTWDQCSRENTVNSLRRYANSYPNGRYLPEARSRMTGLLTSPEPLSAAAKTGTSKAMEDFLREFPGHSGESSARQILREMKEPRDVVDLIAEGKVEVEPRGSGISSVSLRIRRLTLYPLIVRIPAGSYFVSARRSAQNMVATQESEVRLGGDRWEDVSVSAACANRPRDIPDGDDSFTVQRLPNQDELARLVSALNNARVDFATRQAAVWIVTDDASYADLGILVSAPAGFPHGAGFRSIREDDAARAMKICSEAGVDIRRKRIWSDRRVILQGLNDAELAAWIRAK